MFNFSRFPLSPFFTQENGIELLRNYHRPYPRLIAPNIRRWANTTLKLYEMYAERYGKPDIIHVHSATWGAYAASLIKKKYKVPYVVTEHRGVFGCKSSYALNFFKPEFAEFFTEGYSNADYLLPVSDQLIPKMSEFLTRKVPFKVVSNIVDTDFFTPSAQPKPHSPFRFISVNGFYEVKGYDILLPAFDNLCTQYPEVNLTIVGENFESKSFQKLFSQIQHKGNISFAGELNKEGVLRQLQTADAFVLSSRVESQSVSTLEALSVGLPCVVTDVVPLYTAPETLAVRIPIENISQLTEAIKMMIDNYGSYYHPHVAHEHIEKIANKSVVANQLIEIFESVCGNRKSYGD